MGFFSKLKKKLKKITLKKSLPILAGVGAISLAVATGGASAGLMAGIGALGKLNKNKNNSKALGNGGSGSGAMDSQYYNSSNPSNQGGSVGIWARIVSFFKGGR